MISVTRVEVLGRREAKHSYYRLTRNFNARGFTHAEPNTTFGPDRCACTTHWDTMYELYLEHRALERPNATTLSVTISSMCRTFCSLQRMRSLQLPSSSNQTTTMLFFSGPKLNCVIGGSKGLKPQISSGAPRRNRGYDFTLTKACLTSKDRDNDLYIRTNATSILYPLTTPIKMRRSMYSNPSHSYTPAKVAVEVPKTKERRPSSPSPRTSPVLSPLRTGPIRPLDVSRRSTWSASPENMVGALNAVRVHNTGSSISSLSDASSSSSRPSKIPRARKTHRSNTMDSMTSEGSDFLKTAVPVTRCNAEVQTEPEAPPLPEVTPLVEMAQPTRPEVQDAAPVEVVAERKSVEVQTSAEAEDDLLPTLVVDINFKLSSIAKIQNQLVAARPNDEAALRSAVETLAHLNSIATLLKEASPPSTITY